MEKERACERITAAKVKLVGENREVSIVDTSVLLKEAKESGQTVVVLNNKEEIPVVKLVDDYNKYLYEKQKKEKENKKRARLNSQDIKEIQISPDIAQHDLEVKAKNIDRILNDGDKVRLVIKYKGRSIRLIGTGEEKLNNLCSLITVKYKIDKPSKTEGNKVAMQIAPIK